MMRSSLRGLWVMLCPLVLWAGCRDDAEDPTADSSTAGDDAGHDGPFRLEFEEIEVDGDLGLVTDFEFLPGGMELLVLSKDGRIGHYALEEQRARLLGELVVPGVYSDLDCGLLSIAVDPDFASNAFVFVGTCTSEQDNAVLRFRFDPADYAATAASTAEILVAGDPNAPRPWHNIGTMGFDSTGALWTLFGDKKVSSNGQALGNDLSAVVRIIPNREPDGSGHEPAPDNPFIGDPEVSPNVYAYGLRSPWRGVLDAQGRWFFGDVGANGFEEINMVDAPGQNFGWATHEGPCQGDCAGMVDPIVLWPHDEITDYMLDDDEVIATNARVAWVGGPYDGAANDRYAGNLDDKVLFGDYCLGFVRTLEVDAAGQVVADEHVGHLALPVAWRQGGDGFLYTATFGKCETLGLDPAEPPRSRLYRVVGRGGQEHGDDTQ